MTIIRGRATAGPVEEARRDDYMLYIRFYCEAPECSVREIDVTVKDYERDLVAILREKGPRCPVCGSPDVSIHFVETREQYKLREEREARWSVNVQRRRRDTGSICMLASELTDDTLPP